jgi:hypothetical protein
LRYAFLGSNCSVSVAQYDAPRVAQMVDHRVVLGAATAEHDVAALLGVQRE